MIVAIVSFALILLSITFKRSKSLFTILFLWMWIIMAFTTDIADEKEVYMSRYMSPELWANSSELLYSEIISVSNKFGLSFYAFKATITFIQLLLIFCTINKFSKFPNLVACLFMLYPFPLNVAQMRNALATSIFVFSMRYLIGDDLETKVKRFKLTKNDVKYIVSILVASMVHSASLIWLVLLFAKKFNLKKNIIITLFVNAFMTLFPPAYAAKILGFFGAGGRMAAYLSTDYQNSSWRHYGGALLNVTFTAVILIFICLYILNKKDKFTNTKQVSFLLKADIAILCIYGLILKYTGEVYRLQEGMTVLNLVLITNSFEPQFFEKKHMGLSTAKVFGILVLFVIGIFYIAIGTYLIPTIIEPILNNNMLINEIFR